MFGDIDTLFINENGRGRYIWEVLKINKEKGPRTKDKQTNSNKIM